MSDLHIVLGAGPLGRSVAEALVRRGKTVRMINRSGALDEAPEGVEVIGGNLYDPAALRELTDGAVAVYQCAQPHYHEWPQKFPPLQSAIIDGVAGAGTRLVIAENLYMYGEVAGPIREGLPYNAKTRKGKVRAAMSEAAMAAHRSGRVQVAIGRGSDFFGPWALGSSHGERVFYPALAGKSASFGGKLDLPHTATYIVDFGEALAILGEREEALGQSWHVPNSRPEITQRQFGELVFKEVGLPPKMSAIGETMMSVAGIFIPAARESVEMMYEFEQPSVVDSSKFEGTFGMSATPIEAAVKETVAWYRAHPKSKA